MGKNEAGVFQGSDALVVSEVRNACPLGALLVGLPLGGFSGTLIYAQALAFFSLTSGSGAFSGWLFPVFFLGGWALSTWLISYGARNYLTALSRAFLLGGIEWITLDLVRMYSPLKAVAAATHSTVGVAETWAYGTLMDRWLDTAAPVALGILCLLGWFFSAMLARFLLPTVNVRGEQ